jgi:hypothetical protein
MLRTLLMPTAFALLLLSGIVHGLWTDRWQVSAAIEATVPRLDRLPTTLGDWDSESLELDQRQLAMAGAAGYLARRYKNRSTGSTVNMTLLCGRAGHLSAHTPDLCYGGAGYQIVALPVPQLVSFGAATSPAEFKRATFEKPETARGGQLLIYWSWSATGSWQAPDNPRLTFARQPVLFKLYVSQEMSLDEDGSENDACVELMQQLLPALETALFSANSAA